MKSGKKDRNTVKEEPVRMRKSLMEYDAVIFDVDGTLYFQRPMRLKMAWRLGCFYLLRPWRLRELAALKYFRKLRERWQEEKEENSGGPLDQRQYEAVGKKLGMAASRVKETVERWMYETPLDLLPGCQDRMITGLMERLSRRGAAVMVYSDYPAQDKLKAMGVPVQEGRVFCALDPDMMCLKPDPKGMRHILETAGFQPEQALMIGDRYSRDGLSAKNVGADWLILPASPRQRRKLLKEILDES